MLSGLLLAVFFFLLLVEVFCGCFSLEHWHDLFLALLEVPAAPSHGFMSSHKLKVSINVGHGVTIVGVHDGLLEFCLYQQEKDVNDSEVSTDEIALSFEVVVGGL